MNNKYQRYQYQNGEGQQSEGQNSEDNQLDDSDFDQQQQQQKHTQQQQRPSSTHPSHPHHHNHPISMTKDSSPSVVQQQTLQQKLYKKKLQILKKLQNQNIKTAQQYETILQKLNSQNINLRSDYELLVQKVQLLKIKQLRKARQRKQANMKYNPSKEFHQLKKQLKKKYQQLNKWRKKSTKSSTKFAIKIQYQQFANRLVQLSAQQQQLLITYKDEKKLNKKLNKDLKMLVFLNQTSNKQIQDIQAQNKELKTKIFLLRKITNNQGQSEIDLHNFKIGMKERERKVNDLLKYEMINQRARVKKESKGEASNMQTRNTKQQYFYEDRENTQQNQTKVRARTQTSLIKINHLTEQPRHSTKAHKYTQQISQTDKKLPPINQAIISYFNTYHQPPSFITFQSLTKQQINSLSHYQRVQVKKIQDLCLELLLRISELQKHINPNYKRQKSKIILSKQKDILFTKNKILVKELKNVFINKVKILEEYNIYQKYYGVIEKKDKKVFLLDQAPYENRELEFSSLREAEKQKQFNRSRSEMKFVKNGLVNGLRPLVSAKPGFNNQRSASLNKHNKQYQQDVQKYLNQNILRDCHPQGQQQNLASQPQQSQLSPAIQYKQKSIQTQFIKFFTKNPQSKSKNSAIIRMKRDYIGQICTSNLDFDDTIYSHIGKMLINEFTIYHSNKGVHFIECKYKLINSKFKIQTKGNKNNIYNNDYEIFVSTESSYLLGKDFQSFNYMVKKMMDKNAEEGNISNRQIKQKSKKNKGQQENGKLQNQKYWMSLVSEIQCTTTELSVNDYIKDVKIFYNIESKYVSKMQLISKYNVKYQFGNKNLTFPTKLIPYLNIDINSNNRRNASSINKKQSKLRNNSNSKPSRQDSLNKRRQQVNKKQQQQENNKRNTTFNKYYQFEIGQSQYPSFMFGNYAEVDGVMMLAGVGFVVEKEEKEK